MLPQKPITVSIYSLAKTRASGSSAGLQCFTPGPTVQLKDSHSKLEKLFTNSEQSIAKFHSELTIITAFHFITGGYVSLKNITDFQVYR